MTAGFAKYWWLYGLKVFTIHLGGGEWTVTVNVRLWLVEPHGIVEMGPVRLRYLSPHVAAEYTVGW